MYSQFALVVPVLALLSSLIFEAHADVKWNLTTQDPNAGRGTLFLTHTLFDHYFETYVHDPLDPDSTTTLTLRTRYAFRHAPRTPAACRDAPGEGHFARGGAALRERAQRVNATLHEGLRALGAKVAAASAPLPLDLLQNTTLPRILARPQLAGHFSVARAPAVRAALHALRRGLAGVRTAEATAPCAWVATLVRDALGVQVDVGRGAPEANPMGVQFLRVRFPLVMGPAALARGVKGARASIQAIRSTRVKGVRSEMAARAHFTLPGSGSTFQGTKQFRKITQEREQQELEVTQLEQVFKSYNELLQCLVLQAAFDVFKEYYP